MCARILVAGGNGFIGSEICRMAVEQGHDVISLSRHGQPAQTEPWMDRVTWVQGNILAPEEWRQHLEGCDAVVHAVGLDHEDQGEGRTYERMYRDSVEILAWEAEHAGVEHFVCLSAKANPPFRSHRYIDAKREAEAFLRGRGFHESILRPSYVYGDRHPASRIVAAMMQAAAHVPGLSDTLRALRPLPVEQVAAAALRAATESGYEGAIDVDNIEYIAQELLQRQNGGQVMAAPRTDRAPRMRRYAVIGVAAAALAGGIAVTLLKQRRSKNPIERLMSRLPLS